MLIDIVMPLVQFKNMFGFSDLIIVYIKLDFSCICLKLCNNRPKCVRSSCSDGIGGIISVILNIAKMMEHCKKSKVMRSVDSAVINHKAI